MLFVVTRNMVISLLSIIVGATTIEITIARLFGISRSSSDPQNFTLITFLIIYLIYCIGQFILLRWTKQTFINDNVNFSFNTSTFKFVKLVQFILIIIFAFTIAQIFITHSYLNIFVMIAIWISYGFSSTVMFYLAFKLIRWYMDNRNFLVLTYFVAVVILVFNILITMAFTTQIIFDQHVLVKEFIAHYVPILPQPTSTIHTYSVIVSFACMWIASGIFLRSLTKLNKIKYWGLMIIPLIYYLAQFQPYLENYLIGYFLFDLFGFAFAYTIIFTAIEPIGGFLFGLAFWITSRKLESRLMKDYLFICGSGLLLFFVSNHASILVNYPFPPFGLIQMGYLSISAYFIFTGIHSSAIAVAQDNQIRTAIRRSVEQQRSSFIDNIGTSEMSTIVYKRTLELTKKLSDSMLQDSNVRPSLTSEQVRDYIEEVMREKGMIDSN